MTLYGGIDLHSNNSLIALLDDHDKVVFEKSVPNELIPILAHLAPYQARLVGLVVESTYNWYWLVDSLLDAGYQVHLANTAAIKQYEGLKATNDRDDARWLAHLLRLGILPEGYIYPKEERAVHDLLRKRAQLVRHKVTQRLSIQSQWTRHTGRSLSANRIRQLTEDDVDRVLPNRHVACAVKSNLTVLRCLENQITSLERLTKTQAKPKRELALLKTVPGIGDVLALTILLETGPITRFATVGQFASYCRCVASQRLSNGQVKGYGNTKNGNKYLAWAFVEAANFAVRFDPHIKRFYQRKVAATHKLVAIKTVAHKLARACYDMMREPGPFERHKAFGL
jgi:transposase